GASHGAAGAGRFHRTGCLPRHHARAASRAGRSEISSLPAADQDGRCRKAREEIRAGLLQIFMSRRREIFIYLLAVLAGLAAGTIEITINDLLVTAIFVMM